MGAKDQPLLLKTNSVLEHRFRRHHAVVVGLRQNVFGVVVVLDRLEETIPWYRCLDRPPLPHCSGMPQQARCSLPGALRQLLLYGMEASAEQKVSLPPLVQQHLLAAAHRGYMVRLDKNWLVMQC